MPVLDFGLATTDPYGRAQAAGRTVAYMLIYRHSAAVCIWAWDPLFIATSLEAQLINFKMALCTGRKCHALFVPLKDGGKPDRPMLLVR